MSSFPVHDQVSTQVALGSCHAFLLWWGGTCDKPKNVCIRGYTCFIKQAIFRFDLLNGDLKEKLVLFDPELVAQ